MEESDSREDGEHNGVGVAAISSMFEIHDKSFIETASFDEVS